MDGYEYFLSKEIQNLYKFIRFSYTRRSKQ